jgi:hypothetical protein
MGSRFVDIVPADTGTCAWLFQHEAYGSWVACNQSLLWIKGKPGSGKSKLLKYALKHCQARDNDLILFFFHGRGDALQKTPLGLFQTLLHQVLGQAPDELSDLVDVFTSRHKEISKYGEKWQWHQEELQHFLKLSLSRLIKPRPVWLFIDAPDECGEDNAVHLVELFKSWLTSFVLRATDINRIHICFACRPYLILDLDVNPDYVFEINPEKENQGYISVFVNGRLSAFRVRTSAEIPALIINRAAGVFMWARLVAKQVRDLERKGEVLRRIEAAIRSIPSELDELHNGLIQGMKSASLKLIQWLCVATRSLPLDELRWAMVVNADMVYTCHYRHVRA